MLKLLIGFFVGFLGVSQITSAKTVAAPIFINKGSSKLVWMKDTLAQLTDHSMIVWNTKTWNQQKELMSGNFNTAEAIGMLADGTIIGIRNRGFAPYHQVYLVPTNRLPSTEDKELFLPALDYPLNGFRIFPSLQSSHQFWVMSAYEQIPLSLFSLPEQGENKITLRKNFPVGTVNFSTLSQLSNGSFLFSKDKQIHIINVEGNKKNISLQGDIEEIWHLRPFSKSNLSWVIFSKKTLDKESTQKVPEAMIGIVDLNKKGIFKMQPISLGNAWVHSVDIVQDKIALLLLKKNEETWEHTWSIELRKQDGTLQVLIKNVPLQGSVTSPCEIKMDPHEKQLVLLCGLYRHQLWVNQIGSPEWKQLLPAKTP